MARTDDRRPGRLHRRCSRAGRAPSRSAIPSTASTSRRDLSRQVARADRRRQGRSAIYPVSSGKPSTPTVQGSFRVYSKTPGTNAKGMFDSNYFIRGYAIHGYASVPVYTASHGCLRVPIPNARLDLQLAADRRHRRRLPVGLVGLGDQQVEQRRHPAARRGRRAGGRRRCPRRRMRSIALERVGSRRARARTAARARARRARPRGTGRIAPSTSRPSRRSPSRAGAERGLHERLARDDQALAAVVRLGARERRARARRGRPPTTAADWLSIARTSTVPRRGCGRMSHHRNV